MRIAERMRRLGWSLGKRSFYWTKQVAGAQCIIDTAYREGWIFTPWNKERHFIVSPSDNPFDYTAVAPYGLVDIAQRLAAAARKLARTPRCNG